MVRVIVLSLKDSPRREIITKRLAKRGINDFEFYDAFDARNMEMSELEKLFDIDKFRETYGRDPARGEIGCTLSHLGLWKRISESDCEKWIVLEDDAILMPWFKVIFKNDNFPNVMSLLGYSKFGIGHGLLSNLKHFIIGSYIATTEQKTLYVLGVNKAKNWGFGTVGYSLTKKASIDLLTTVNETPYFLADDYDIHGSVTKVNHVRPFLVYEDFKRMESNIENDRIKLKTEESKR
ncbi:glycosyltransferase family 25 protein [Photobacterium damselae]|uniref:glycosyltransferase family 25 protein n=1 Tax=Photobacterium damselae TaxID=38293 RepID=UPI0009F01D60|nr:glycosyltransferase family 25 protein [Photobacterium damselae]GAW46136.1 Glycosyltransferase family 25 [Photobacterium damselae subsp. piscicida]